MKALIKIQKEGGKPTINARDLWEKLGSKQKYADWIKNRIEKYEFIEGIEFFAILGKTSAKVGRPEKEYHITLDMAKELAMVENNEKGREIRRYFIECEKRLSVETLRDKSKKARNTFTSSLKDHGYTKDHHYIQTTVQMKGILGIEHKKDEMTESELKLITAAELIAEVNLENSEAEGFYSVNPLCLNSTLAIRNATKRLA